MRGQKTRVLKCRAAYALLNGKVIGPLSTAGPFQLREGGFGFENKVGNQGVLLLTGTSSRVVVPGLLHIESIGSTY